jgi:hypothetical protein
MGNSNYVIWVDSNINNAENIMYSMELKLMLDSSIKRYKTIKSAINFLKTVKFVETKIIISGRLYSEFIEQYKNIVASLNTIPKIIIFMSRKDLFIKNNEKYQKILDNPLFNFGGIQTDFKNIKKFITERPNKSSLQNRLSEAKKKDKFDIHVNSFTEVQNSEMTFDYIDSKEKLFLPIFYKTLIDMPNNSFEYYTLSLYDQFSKNKDIKKLLDQIIVFEEPPVELLCK